LAVRRVPKAMPRCPPPLSSDSYTLAVCSGKLLLPSFLSFLVLSRQYTFIVMSFFPPLSFSLTPSQREGNQYRPFFFVPHDMEQSITFLPLLISSFPVFGEHRIAPLLFSAERPPSRKKRHSHKTLFFPLSFLGHHLSVHPFPPFPPPPSSMASSHFDFFFPPPPVCAPFHFFDVVMEVRREKSFLRSSPKWAVKGRPFRPFPFFSHGNGELVPPTYPPPLPPPPQVLLFPSSADLPFHETV